MGIPIGGPMGRPMGIPMARPMGRPMRRPMGRPMGRPMEIPMGRPMVPELKTGNPCASLYFGRLHPNQFEKGHAWLEEDQAQPETGHPSDLTSIYTYIEIVLRLT